MEIVIVMLVLVGCVVAYFVIGDLFDRFFDRRSDDETRDHIRRNRKRRHDKVRFWDDLGGGHMGGGRLNG